MTVCFYARLPLVYHPSTLVRCRTLWWLRRDLRDKGSVMLGPDHVDQESPSTLRAFESGVEEKAGLLRPSEQAFVLLRLESQGRGHVALGGDDPTVLVDRVGHHV